MPTYFVMLMAFYAFTTTDPMSVLNLINEYMPLKPSLVGDPDIYLGAKLKMTRLENEI